MTYALSDTLSLHNLRIYFSTHFSTHRCKKMKRTSTLMAYFLSLSLLAALLLPGISGGARVQAAPAATLTVTNTNDSGAGSLRAAVAAAHPGDTVEFSVTGVITLTTGHILIAKDLTITGPGAAHLTVSGNNASRIFEIAFGSTVAISGLTIANGNAGNGGGIANEGTLTVSHSILSANSATYGGGIDNWGGTLTVSHSTLSANAASWGGGIYNNSTGTLTVSHSTLSQNSAVWDGGGINDWGAVEMTHSTLSHNSAGDEGGGIANWDGTLTVSNSTFSANSAPTAGGGLYNNSGGALSYANTIVANSPSGGDCVNGGALGTNTSNLVKDGSCTAIYSGDPKLGGLSGGVHVPQGDSPAIDAGDAAVCAAAPVNGVDQRGEARNDLGCDIGAVEVQLSDTDTITRSVTGPGVYTFGPTLAQIEVASKGALSQVVVQHHSGDHANATQMNGQWWGITPTGSGFTAALNLPHTVSPDTNATVCKHVTGSTWDCARAGSSATRVWRDGLTAFSDWAVGGDVSAGIAPVISAGSSGADLTLTWSHDEANSNGYIVWYSPSPYFMPGDSGATETAVAAPGGYTHTGVIGALQSLYYLVQGVGGNGVPSNPSNRVGKFAFPLTPGTP